MAVSVCMCVCVCVCCAVYDGGDYGTDRARVQFGNVASPVRYTYAVR